MIGQSVRTSKYQLVPIHTTTLSFYEQPPTAVFLRVGPRGEWGRGSRGLLSWLGTLVEHTPMNAEPVSKRNTLYNHYTKTACLPIIFHQLTLVVTLLALGELGR